MTYLIWENNIDNLFTISKHYCNCNEKLILNILSEVENILFFGKSIVVKKKTYILVSCKL